jgi:hypothetical protein
MPTGGSIHFNTENGIQIVRWFPLGINIDAECRLTNDVQRAEADRVVNVIVFSCIHQLVKFFTKRTGVTIIDLEIKDEIDLNSLMNLL